LDKVKVPSTGEEVAPGDEVALRIGHRALAEISIKAIYESMCWVRYIHTHIHVAVRLVPTAQLLRVTCSWEAPVVTCSSLLVSRVHLLLDQDMMGVEPDAAHLSQIDRDAQLKQGSAPRSRDESAAAAAVAAAIR